MLSNVSYFASTAMGSEASQASKCVVMLLMQLLQDGGNNEMHCISMSPEGVGCLLPVTKGIPLRSQGRHTSNFACMRDSEMYRYSLV